MSSFESKKVPATAPSSVVSTSTASAAAAATTTTTSAARLPGEATLTHAARLAVAEDKPIMMDYWSSSIEGRALIGVRESSGDRLLVKSAEEYTSPIAKFYKSGGEYIVITENSIYMVSNDIATRKIS